MTDVFGHCFILVQFTQEDALVEAVDLFYVAEYYFLLKHGLDTLNTEAAYKHFVLLFLEFNIKERKWVINGTSNVA